MPLEVQALISKQEITCDIHFRAHTLLIFLDLIQIIRHTPSLMFFKWHKGHLAKKLL